MEEPLMSILTPNITPYIAECRTFAVVAGVLLFYDKASYVHSNPLHNPI